MAGKRRVYMNWSGGKDSAMCLYEALQDRTMEVYSLLTSLNAAHDRVSMHGVRRSLLEAQARSIGLPLRTIELPEHPDMPYYETAMHRAVQALGVEGCTGALFGDIFLEDLRQYREKQLREAGMDCFFPLWKKDSAVLARECIRMGFKAVVVCVNDRRLDKSFCGRLYDEAFLRDLPAGVDPCGENGEFHSFVFDGPIFRSPIAFTPGQIVYRQYQAPRVSQREANLEEAYGFYFCDLLSPEAGLRP